VAVEIAARLLLPVAVSAALDAEPHEHVQESDEHSDPDERHAGPQDGVVATERRKKDPDGDDRRGKDEPNRQHRPGRGRQRARSGARPRQRHAAGALSGSEAWVKLDTSAEGSSTNISTL
jgi:hypothetical protein